MNITENDQSKENRIYSEEEVTKVEKKIMDDMKYQIKRSEAITNIVRLLESEQSFEEIAGVILETIGEFLGVSNVSLCKWSVDYAQIMCIMEYVPDGGETVFDKMAVLATPEFVRETKGYIRYERRDSKHPDDRLEELGVQALLTAPITINGRQSMYVCVADTNSRSWKKQTIHFIFDVCKILQSILNRRISKNSIISSYTALKEILDNVGSGLYVIDKRTKKILFANNTMKTIVNDDMEGKFCSQFSLCGLKHNCVNCDILDEPCVYFETYDSRYQSWFDIKFNDITWVDGSTVSLCNVFNITEKKKIEKRIEFQANNDFLTGLYNRMRCESDMDNIITESIEKNLSGYVMFLDLDNFKNINDGLGHQYGDMLLKMISLGLQQIRGIENCCYRMGGDEFVIIVEPSQSSRLKAILKDITSLFNRPWDLNGTEYYCTMSMGVVSYPEEGCDVNDLVKKADIAMYDAKKGGKNRIEFYNNKEDSSSIKRLDLEKNMRSAIVTGGDEFEVYIQPIIDSETEECIGGEALLRWNSANLGFITPAEFIPLAEHLGHIVFIGEFFLKRVCTINKEWSDLGIDKKVHINLSIVQLVQNNIVEVITNIITETGVKPENIVLEVTESLAINDMNNMRKVIKEIKALGVEIALDDFGTGYSSLNYIKQMDFDIIKVDKIIVDDIVSDDYAQTFVKLITELSETLNVKVCVEGVEKRDQLETLKTMKVSMIQGYLYGKPVPYIEFEKNFLGIDRWDKTNFKRGIM